MRPTRRLGAPAPRRGAASRLVAASAPALSPHRSGRRLPLQRAARASVLTSSMARVSGPTPPGTGVMAEAIGRHAVEVDVADQQAALGAEALELGLVAGESARAPRPPSQAVHPHVDHHGARA